MGETIVKDAMDEIFRNDPESSNILKQTKFWSWQESLLIFNVDGCEEEYPGADYC